MQLSLMPLRIILLSVVLPWAIPTTFMATPAAAQIVRIRPGMGIHVNTPYTNIHIDPRYGVRPNYRMPSYGVPPTSGTPRWRAWRRRRDLGRLRGPAKIERPGLALEPKPESKRKPRQARDLGSQTPAAFDESPTPTAAASSDLPDPAQVFPTATDLANLDDTNLLATLSDLSNRLDKRLARYKTGAGWQRYLHLPEEILALPGLSAHENQNTLLVKQERLRETLVRFEQVENNANFQLVASQPSFVAALAALREVASRLDDHNTVTPTASTASDHKQEVLPTPEPARRPVAPSGEHSILKR